MDVLARALNLRREELAPAVLLFFYLFLIIGFYTMGQSVGDTLFLNAFPNHLPHVIIGTAALSGLFVAIYIRLLQRVRLDRLISGTLVFFAGSFVVFWSFTFVPSKFEYPLIYMWVATTAVVGTASGWTSANYVLTTREARRVFGFIGAGAILGGMFGGFFTRVATRYVRSEALLLAMAVFLMICAALIHTLFRISRRRLHAVAVGGAGQDGPRNFRESLSLILGSRYLSLITALVAVGCGATTIIGYQFKMIAKAAYGADKAGLAAFFGTFYGYMGVASFLLQLLITGRLLRSVGIRVTLFIMPAVFMLGGLGVLLVPALWTVSVLRGSQNLLRYSLDRSSTEMLYLPVAPSVKSQIKSFIDIFIYRVADGVAGAALWLFANKIGMSPSRISLVNFAFLGGWIAFAWGVRREYLNVLRRAIDRRQLDPERTAASTLDATTAEVLAVALERGDEQQVLYGLSLFEVGQSASWHPKLRGLLHHSSPAVRQRTLRLLADVGDRAVTPRVEQMVRDSSPEVRAEALHYLVVHTGRDPVSFLGPEANLPDYAVQGSMVAYLARTAKQENFAAAQLILDNMISREGEAGPLSRAEAARVLGVIPAPSELHGELASLIRDEDIAVAEQALVSAGRVAPRDLLPLIIQRLADKRLASYARNALAQYGDRAVGTLQDYLNDDTVRIAVRCHIPGVLARIATPQAAAVLASSLIQSDPGLRFDVLKALNKLRRRDPSLLPARAEFEDMLQAEMIGYYRSFQILAAFDEQAASRRRRDGRPESVLVRALRERMQHELERIFRLIGLIYEPTDIHNAYAGLTSGRPHLQANALEVLEHLLRPELYRALTYTLDPEIGLREKLEFARQQCRTTIASRAEALRILLRSQDRWLAACALHEIGSGRLSELEPDLRSMPQDGDPLLAETHRWASLRLSEYAERGMKPF